MNSPPPDEPVASFGCPRTLIDHCEFSFDSDGDLQINLDPEGHRDGRTHYFSPKQAAQLRDWLTQVLK